MVSQNLQYVHSLKQLEDNLEATEITLSADEITACDELWQQMAPRQFLYGR